MYDIPERMTISQKKCRKAIYYLTIAQARPNLYCVFWRPAPDNTSCRYRRWEKIGVKCKVKPVCNEKNLRMLQKSGSKKDMACQICHGNQVYRVAKWLTKKGETYFSILVQYLKTLLQIEIHMPTYWNTYTSPWILTERKSTIENML